MRRATEYDPRHWRWVLAWPGWPDSMGGRGRQLRFKMLGKSRSFFLFILWIFIYFLNFQSKRTDLINNVFFVDKFPPFREITIRIFYKNYKVGAKAQWQ